MPLPDATSPAPPAPRHALAWAALAYALFALLLAYPALGGAFLVNGLSDQYIAGYPFREFAAASLRAGEGFPLWNPYQYGGMPYVAAMHGDIFYPTFLLRMLLPRVSPVREEVNSFSGIATGSNADNRGA